MRNVLSAIAVVVVLGGCASAPPKPEWKLVDGAWVGPQTTYQDQSRLPCNYSDPSLWCKVLKTLNDAWTNAEPGVKALGKMK